MDLDNDEVLVLKWHCNNYLDNKFHSLPFFKQTETVQSWRNSYL